MIRKANGKFVLYSKDGSKKLGEFNTMKQAEDREKQINAIKHSALLTVKTSLAKDGTMRWKATCSEASPDLSGESTSLELFKDWIDRVETGKSEAWIPDEPRVPFLGVSHYPSLDGFGEAGPTEKMYINGKTFKANGTFYQDEGHPLGPILFEAIRNDPELVSKGEVDQEIKISAAWWDIQHSHGDFVFNRKSLTDKCPMCEKGQLEGKIYLKGQLDHFAGTRVPMHPSTGIGLEEKSMTTRKEDAESILGEEAAKKLEDAIGADVGKALVSKSEEDLTEKAFTMDEALALRQAEKLQNKVWNLFDLFMLVVSDIQFFAEAEEKVELLVQATTDFGNMVADLKNNMPDVMAMMAQVERNEVDIMSEKTEVQNDGADVYSQLKDTVANAINDHGLNREQKYEAIQPVLKSVADQIKSSVEQATPVDTATLVASEVSKAMSPIAEQLSLIAAKLGNNSPQPVQKSYQPGQPPQPVNPSQQGLAVSSITGQPSSLRTRINAKVQQAMQTGHQ